MGSSACGTVPLHAPFHTSFVKSANNEGSSSANCESLVFDLKVRVLTLQVRTRAPCMRPDPLPSAGRSCSVPQGQVHLADAGLQVTYIEATPCSILENAPLLIRFTNRGKTLR